MKIIPILAALALSGSLTACVEVVPAGPVATGAGQILAPQAQVAAPVGFDSGPPRFRKVVSRMELVIERECSRRSRANCDFLIRVDERADQPANAYQSLDPSGRPLITFTRTLIRDTRNDDELAFVLGHEASHHIAAHIARQRQEATVGAAMGSVLAGALGVDSNVADMAQKIGGTVAARYYSKDKELEADRLGTLLAWQAGYDPVRGAAYFTRIPDPGNRFLGSHPPNADRVQTVQAAMADIRAGRLR